MNNFKNGISIIICCYNSSRLLADTIKHITNLKIPDSIYCELILVNNISTDSTSTVAKIEWNKYETEIVLKIVDEFKPGLIYARKKGVQESSNEFIIFCDDDNWLQNDYLLIAHQKMVEMPNIGALGGQGIAISNSVFPDWFEKVKSNYACGKQWHKSGLCTEKLSLWGAGLVSRKSVLDKVFETPFRLTGRNGDKILAGDDSEICMRIILLGFELYYDQNLRYHHFIDPKRLNKEYHMKMSQGFIMSSKYLDYYRLKIIKMKNSGFNYYWVLVRDLIILFLVKLRILKRPKRYVANVFKLNV